jgi:predicted transcriptional regulator of viral defense system
MDHGKYAALRLIASQVCSNTSVLTKRILSLAANRQIIRSKEASALGVPRNYLSRFVQKGLLKRVGRGLYTSPSSLATEHLSLVEAAYKVPNGIICLLSALQFHKFTTQAPHQVWMAIDVKAWAPRVTSPATRFVRMSGPALQFGVKEHPVRGGTLMRLATTRLEKRRSFHGHLQSKCSRSRRLPSECLSKY